MSTFKNRRLLRITLGILPVVCNSCTSAELWSTGGGHMLVTQAEYRAINQTTVGTQSVHGRVTPAYITCAEPSPDVAKAVSTAFNASGSGGVTLPNGVTADVAAAVSRARAEALVQLGERLATIQLLRDGLHSACEAYANGAISDTTYAVMLSRFDKTMVTMLATELAAGAFGRSLAGAGMSSEGRASASADLEAKIAKSRELEQELKNAQDAQNIASQHAGNATPEAKAAAQQKLETTRKDVQKKESDYKNAVKAMSDSAAKLAQLNTAGAITAHNNPDIAKTISDMQRKYIENLNFDALEVACISALDRGLDVAEVRARAETYGVASDDYGRKLAEEYRTPVDGSRHGTKDTALVQASARTTTAGNDMAAVAQSSSMTPLAGYCLSSVLPMIQAKKGELLNAVIKESWARKEAADSRANLKNSLTEVKDYINSASSVLEQVKILKAGPGK